MSYKLKNCLILFVLAAFVATGVLACGEMDAEEEQVNANHDNDGDTEESIEVEGTWETQFETTEVIDDENWDFMAIIDFDNEERWAITQNPDDSEYAPSAFNRLVWTPIENDVFYYCTVDFALDTEQEARESEETADDSDPESGGCGDFPWTEMTRQ